MFSGQQGAFDMSMVQQPPIEPPEPEETDNAHRPPNAFILYTQAMRTQARQENPSLSNTEVSRLLGKMWKDVPSEIKLQYKQKAAAMQEEFKREHPDYTYRKARRKRALNELLTKSGQPYAMGGFPPVDPNMAQNFQAMMAQNPHAMGMLQNPGQGFMMPGQPQQQSIPGMMPTQPFGQSFAMPGMGQQMGGISQPMPGQDTFAALSSFQGK